MKTICLIGMMGSGKTTIAKLLSECYGIKFVDIDFLIETNEGMKISEIFKQKGESYFRQIEKDTIKKYFVSENMIISLGGGAFEDSDTQKLLLDNSIVIYLKTSPNTIYERIKNDKSRPLLCDKMSVDTIYEIIQKREKNYLNAHKVVETDNKKPEDIIRELRND
jgi:shikimate kinase